MLRRPRGAFQQERAIMITAEQLSELRALYARDRRAGAGIETAIDGCWRFARQNYPELRAKRAPWGVEQIAANTGSRRSYRSPLGAFLGVAVWEYGHHCAKWRRTVRSEKEREEVLWAIAEALGEPPRATRAA